jgi:hypothetical protein
VVLERQTWENKARLIVRARVSLVRDGERENEEKLKFSSNMVAVVVGITALEAER